jgi:hypothetical protein
MSFSIVASVGSGAAACSNSNFDLYSTASFAEKMTSLSDLNSELLKSSGFRLAWKYNATVLKNFVDSLVENSGDIKEGTLVSQLTANARLIIVANDALYQIGKIPGYHWITEKLRIQASNFQLYNPDSWSSDNLPNTLDIFARFVSSWMQEINDWGLSITFFENKNTEPGAPVVYVPWHGINAPIGLRININQKIVSYNGEIQIGSSNPNAIHYKADGTPWEIYPGIEDQNYIYQGWVSGTDIISIDGMIKDTEDAAIASDALIYTPSSIDLINNKLSDFAVDDIINEFTDVFKSELEDSILNNPIYLGDGTKNQNVIDRINNAPFMTLFKVMLGRRNMEDGHWKKIYGNVDIDSDEEKIQQMTLISDSLWDDVMTFVDSIESVGNHELSGEDQDNVDLLRKWKKEDYGVFDTDNRNIENHAQELEDAIKALLESSRQFINDDHEYYALNVSHIINVQAFFYNGDGVKLFTDIDLTLYGNNDDYNFGVYMFGTDPTFDKNNILQFISEHSNQIYHPDDNETPGKVADRGFKNVSVHQRFKKEEEEEGTMWTNYNAYADANWPWATVHDKYTLVGADILNPKTLPALASKYSDLGDPTQTDWFDDDSNGYLKKMGLTTGKDITLGSFASLFSRAVRGKINRIFTFNPEKGTMPIWNINNKFSVSADVSLTAGDKTTGVITYDKSKPYNYDDDIAFSDIIAAKGVNQGKQILFPTEFVGQGTTQGATPVSDIRSKLYHYGYDEEAIKLVDYNILYGKANSSGEVTSEQFTYDYIKHNQQILTDNRTAINGYKAFIRTTTQSKTPIPDSLKYALKNFYQYWVLCNPDKEGHGYNPNAGACKEE